MEREEAGVAVRHVLHGVPVEDDGNHVILVERDKGLHDVLAAYERDVAFV